MFLGQSRNMSVALEMALKMNSLKFRNDSDADVFAPFADVSMAAGFNYYLF